MSDREKNESTPNPQKNAEKAPADAAPVDENRLVRERYEKAGGLTEAGIALFPERFDPTHHADEIHERREMLLENGDPVTIAGRVIGVRSFGKAGFLVVRDRTGTIQVYVKKDITDPDGFTFFKKGMDTGDIVGVTGRVFVTKTGELTVEAASLRLLSKSMRPLPEKWHGLKDVEIRYRRRYVDLIANPDVRQTFRTRSKIIRSIRCFLDARGYVEVETPMMQSIYGGAAARPFVTHHNALDMDLYLRIAPELFLKRLIVGGFERVYEINRNFRNEGLSTQHNPEFTMLELYTAWWDYNDTMALTEKIVRETAREALGTTEIEYQGQRIDLGEPFRRIRIVDAIAEALNLGSDHGLHWGIESIAALKDAMGEAAQAGATVRQALETAGTADAALIAIFEELIEADLIQPTFVVDFPKSLCPLAKSKADDPATAARFEFFCGGLEMANAYSELNDPAEQRRRFEEQVAARDAGDEEAMNEIDVDYVRALEYGMAPCSGLGIGIDRLVMLLTDSASIRDVILFPLMRPEK